MKEQTLNRKKQPKVNYFGDTITAYINGKYKEGVFLDIDTEEPIRLKDDFNIGVPVRIIAPLDSIPDNEYKHHWSQTTRKFISAGAILDFEMEDKHKNQRYAFHIRLLEDLYIGQRGNKFNRMFSCKCQVEEVRLLSTNKKLHEGSDLIFESLNKAYTRLSVLYRPENSNHNCNVFKTVKYNGNYLERLRNSN